MERRVLGKTGLGVSILGLGGFHLLEISVEDVRSIVDYYLGMGGNYLETAAAYGDGESESKIRIAFSGRREDCILATKCHLRNQSEAALLIDKSLENLGTDWVDILFLHGVSTFEEMETVLSSQGSLRAAEEARKAGKIRFIGITGHCPEVLVEALKRYSFDVVMEYFNYFDRFNFPLVEEEILPLAQKQNMGIIGMKPLADGFLWQSAELAFRYAWSLPLATVVSGMNTLGMARKDIAGAESFQPLTPDEKDKLFREAPELGNYVCRLCNQCLPCPQGINIPQLFVLEGYFDRQMRDGMVRNPEEFALRDRLRFWYGNHDFARDKYTRIPVPANACNACGECEPRCPYHIPIIRKLRIVDYKLSPKPKFF